MDKKGAKGGLVFLLVASAQSATAQLLSACEALVQLMPQLRRIDATASAIEECIKAGQDAIACCPLKEASKLHKAYPDTVVTLAADPTITAHYLLATLDPSAVSNIIFAERSRRAAINCRPHQRHAYQFTVTGLVFDQEGSHLFLIPRAKGRWFPPGGHVEEGEFPHEALIREIHEETGYTVTFLQQPAETGLRIENTYFVPHPYRTLLVDLGTHYHFDLLYLCRVASPPPEPTEYNGQWFLPTQALELPLPRELARILQELPKPLLHDI